MCQNAEKTALALLTAEEPELKSILTFTGLLNTPTGQVVLDEYNQAVQDLSAWTPGTAAQEIIEVIQDFQSGFNELPFPPTVITLENLIEAAVVAVIGVIQANQPSTSALDQAHAVAATTAQVQKLVPGFKPRIKRFALPGQTPADQFKKAWKNQVALLKSEGLPNVEALEV